MDENEYRSAFAEPKELSGSKESETRAGRALLLALDIRKFEIELYWKRATYFWAFIAAAFTGYALSVASPKTEVTSLSLVFAGLGLIFSLAWYLVNRGSKYWQNNWESHVDLLEDISLGPLYKTVVDSSGSNPLISAAPFSVSKINQMLSVYVTIIWLALFIRNIGPLCIDKPIDLQKLFVSILTAVAVAAMFYYGRSHSDRGRISLKSRVVRASG